MLAFIYAGAHNRYGRSIGRGSPMADCSGWRGWTVKSASSLLPEHEGLRRAVQWLATQSSWDAKVIEEASRQFDLSPIDEEFLLRHFCAAKHSNGDPVT